MGAQGHEIGAGAESTGAELQRRASRHALHRAADWAGHGIDRAFKRVLRSLYLSRGVPYMSRAELERSLRMLHCYTDPAILAEPDRLFAAPGRTPPVRTLSRRPIRGGVHEHYAFETPFEPVHRIYASEFRLYDRVDTVHLFGWRHARPAPASIVLVHGWGLGPKALAMREFGIDFLFRELGLDVYFFVLPFHGLRKPSKARFSGELFPSPNLMRTNEGFVQIVRELRMVLGFVDRHNPAPIGLMGSSLGGYVTALVASVDPRVAFAIPVLPIGSLADLFWEQGEGDDVRAQVERMGMTRERFAEAWAVHSPLSYRPKTAWTHRMLVSAGGDALVPALHVDRLWQHWDRPRHHTFAGGHIFQAYAADYHRHVGQFLAELGYVPASRVALVLGRSPRP